MPNILKFESARSISESEPEEPDYILEQQIIRGAITSFSAKIKVGKTTYLGAAIYAILHEEDLISLRTKPAKILYCTEEGRKTFRSFLKRTGLEQEDNLEVLFMGSVPRDLPWLAVVKDILGHALSIKADVVIFDTLTRWAHVGPDKENDAGAAAEAMEPLEMLRAANLAVVAVFHDRKSGGDVSDSARGSSAFGGAADIILNLVHNGTNGHANRRTIYSVGRFDDPATWTIDWEDGAYILMGQDGDQRVERNTAKESVQLQLMMGEMDTQSLATALGTSPTSGTFRRAVDEMLMAKQMIRVGEGRRGSPYIYRAP